jgi:hypothetical protein
MGAEKAKDQPLAWNRGTTGIATSREPMPRKSAPLTDSEWSTLERCE